MNNTIDKKPEESKETIKSMQAWLGYGAEFFTIFFALAVLAGRVYALSYWKVFGLSPELVETNFINYAIMSPNVAVASVLMAASTILIITLLRRQLPDFIGDKNPRVAYFFGFFALWAGLLVVAVIMHINTSTWTVGTAGLAFGLGYLCFIGGPIVWMQAGLKLEKKEPSKWEIVIFRWLKNIPSVFVLVFIVVGYTATTIWAIADTAQKFGVNEAKMMYDARPVVTLQLDSPKGFEDLSLVPNPSGETLLRVKLITEAGGFLYVSTGVKETPRQIFIRAIPVPRIQGIQYFMDISPLGK
jgi:hypothetical protein